jgi:hypothetical protein
MTKSLSADTLAEIARADKLFAPYEELTRRLAGHRAEMASSRTRATDVRQAYLAALAASDQARVSAARSQETELQAAIAAGPEVEALLETQAREAGLRWSEQWHIAREAIEAEMLDGLAARRAKLDREESETRAACAARIAEMRS